MAKAARIAMIAAGLALIVSQPVLAAPGLGTFDAPAEGGGGGGPVPAPGFGPGAIVMSLAALSAFVAGLVAAAKANERHPTSP
jgi:hypothetical protein